MFNPNNIRNKGFSVQKSGYSTDEVSDYLHDVADDYAALVKENQEKDAKIEKLVEKVNELLADKDAITDALVNAQKEARKIINDAKQQSKEMVDGAKSEQMRLAEQSAAECERIVTEHKEKCAQLIRDNTAVTEKKINTIRAAYEDELARYKQLQADVTYFKANLTELYNKQIRLVMELPTMTPEELEEFEASLDELEDEEYYEEEPAVQEEPVSFAPEEPVQTDEPFAQGVQNSENIDKILQTGSFDPVIPKSNFNDLKFGKNN
jgi:cell division initiation protein